MTQGRVRTGGLACALAFATTLALASSAAAAGPYYASPGGSGASCTPSARCSVNQAVDLAVAGESVLLAPGTYELTGNLGLRGTLMPETAGTRPILHSTVGNTLRLLGPASVARDLRLEISGLSIEYALRVESTGLAERIEVAASGPSSPFAGLLSGGGTIADSVLAVSGDGAAAFATGDSGGTIRNVTAVATGTNSFGLYTGPGYMTVPSQTVTVQNSIVRALTDFYAYGDPGKSITINLDHTNRPDTEAIIGAFATMNESDPPQTTAPLFAGPGDFHQLASSVTRDA